MSENINEVKVKDFYQACVIKTLGFPLKRLDAGGERFRIFVFDDPEFMAEEKLGQYWDGQLRVDPKQLIDTIVDLKNRLYAERGVLR